MNFEKLLWIRGKNESETCKPILVGIADGKMYWHAGITCCNWTPERYNIVREFPYIDYESINQADDKLEEEYAPKPQKPCARLGWVSPDGDFYPCAYCCHSDLERILNQQIYNTPWPPLRQKGWTEIKSGALICFEYNAILPQAAKDTIRKIVEAFEFEELQNPDINWREILECNSEGYSQQDGWSDPTEKLIGGNTYAKAMRSRYELYFGEGDVDVKSTSLAIPPCYDGTVSKRKGEHPGD